MTLLTTSNGPKSGVRNAIKALADEASGQIADARHFAQRVRTANIPDGDPFPNTPSGGLVLKALATSATLAALTQKIGNLKPGDTPAFLPAAAPFAYAAVVVAERLRTETEPNRPGRASSHTVAPVPELKSAGIDNDPASAELLELRELMDANAGTVSDLGR
ncbi:MAG: hypothetical protein KBF89_08130 [Acidimicrobiia bacterium]|jgi:hypothetical protein|nr:hypothetical protein [Acidimicrobiia bacterium]